MREEGLETIPKKLQNVVMPEDELARAAAIAKATNERVREAADARLQFEDEPASYAAFLNRE